MEVKVSKAMRKKLGLADGESFHVKSTVDAFEEKGQVDFNKPLPREHQAVLSTGTVDLDDEVLVPKGCDLTIFAKNPLAFFGHEWRGTPIGNWKDATATPSKVAATLSLVERPADHPKEVVWRPDEVNYLIHRKVLRGVSVGFKRHEQGPPDEKEVEKSPEWAKARNVVRRWTLLEASVVPMPCNHEAWLKEVSEGTVSKDMRETLEAPEHLTLESGLWDKAHAWLKGELSEVALAADPDVEMIRYIVSILALHGFDRNLLEKAARADITPKPPVPIAPSEALSYEARAALIAATTKIILDKVLATVDNVVARATGRVFRRD